MRKRREASGEYVRMLDQKQAEAYTGMGRTSLTSWATKIGAKRKFGRLVRYDREVIDAAFDAMDADGDSFTGAGGR